MSHPLADCRSKLTWALDHIKQISEYMRTDGSTELPRDAIRMKVHGKATRVSGVLGPHTQTIVFNLFGNFPVLPVKITLLAGEAIHQQRTVLDHLVYQLVIAHTKKPPTFNSAFPIIGRGRMRKKVWQTAVQRYADTVHTLRNNISPSAEALIRGLQPFERLGTSYQDDPLWQLSELDNTYKHRLLTVIAHKLKRCSFTVRKGDDIICSGNFAPEIMFEDGAEIGRTMYVGPSIADPEVRVQFDAMFAIAFPKVAKRTNVSVLLCLQDMNTYVGDILDAFTRLPEFS